MSNSKVKSELILLTIEDRLGNLSELQNKI